MNYIPFTIYTYTFIQFDCALNILFHAMLWMGLLAKLYIRCCITLQYNLSIYPYLFLVQTIQLEAILSHI